MLELSRVRRILVINLKYIGDVLLSTPVVESLKNGLKDISVMMLVQEGTEAVLYNNPHIDGIFAMNSRWRLGKQLKLIRLLRSFHFDLSLDLTDGDRAAILGKLCGIKYRIGFNRERRWRGVLYHQ